ncbi:L-asparaginase [Punctularia strigosozonata HHB-11173 SS5]|uniref:L-asparaginase n=1 Tax=Punctularia strigosozonata (strain HHB-11173) TaxID=741275 RepID=UPI0004417570|nr:L-asparaginase [Punctularia strigosozonata HHB-11173 SS5]EIN07193.1 L-asparaginase [Punctularia strigosozonata HHB-11173 SS5]
MDLSQIPDESKVLIIYTGGTIGMLVGQEGYVPEPYFLTETLRSQNRFHDPLQESLFSHSSSVAGFREWSSSSGRTSPSGERTTPTSYSPATPTLRVLSSRPIGDTMGLRVQPYSGGSPRQPTCRQIEENVYEADIPSLITPRPALHGNGGKRIRYAVLEWNPLLDSSNIEIDDWIRIATEIELNYPLFDAFVVLHGTDTMSYTSSALSFLLEDLGKTVILTGAQIPLSQLRNDAIDNLLGALMIAGHYIIPECSLFFNHTLYRGNRVSKMSSYDLDAFDSPNFPPLVDVGIDITINWNDVIRQTGLRRFHAHKTMSTHVATLRLFPGITSATVRAFLAPPIKGVVLETFGAGNAPQRADLMTTLKEACDRGVVIVAISQCSRGTVSDTYQTGRTLLQAGVVPGGDMTPECALTKLSYLLSKPALSVSEVRRLIGTPLRGELTRPSTATPASGSIEQNLESIQDLLTQVVRLSNANTMAQAPQILIDSSSISSSESTAPWSWTASEALTTEAALLPYLIHLAAAKNDVEALRFCIKTTTPDPAVGVNSPVIDRPQQSQAIAGVLVNALDPASGRSPLHTAALNGSVKCVQTLLEAGALVHLRDSLGHTALYYAARQNHESAVDVLVQAGANLGGSDVDGGFSALAVQKSTRSADDVALRIWTKAGMSAAP